MTSELTERILEYLAVRADVNSLDLVDAFNQDHQKIIGAIKSLQAFEDLISVEPVSQKKWELTQEGQHIVKFGSHEAAVYNAIPENGISQSDIMKSIPNAKIGFSKALVAGWIEIDKTGGSPIVRKKVPSIEDVIQDHLKNLNNVPDRIKVDYRKRKLLQETVIKSMILRKGRNFSTKVEKQEADLTSDLLANGIWKDKKFKPYNFNALGSALDVGHLHPLLKVRAEFRKIFLEMGFTEMPTNNFVENSFWNFDALFQPQQHPARDAHDTFFISDPSVSTNFPEDYLQNVKKVHSEGGYGSQGYRYEWKLEEAQKNLLRTHTTAVSARMLYKLAQQIRSSSTREMYNKITSSENNEALGEFKPVKYFSIDRVFRNETLDATHLAEFHQVEGVIADYNLTLGDLIGTLYEFFKKLGITQLEFKPAYNPYTEPSMEIFCFHNGLDKWIEIGNSGIFRPEMLLPMGLPENVNVIAWGLSLERPTMIKYDLNNIRDLVGPKVDLRMVYNNPICRLEKIGSRTTLSRKKLEIVERRWNDILSNLEQIRYELQNIIQENDSQNKIKKQNIVIFCDPDYPVYSLEALLHFVEQCFTVSVSVHTHSSIIHLPAILKNFCNRYKIINRHADISIVFIWKIMGVDPVMCLPEMNKIIGEINIARYINRLIESKKPEILRYESHGPFYANQIDSLLEKIHSVLHCTTKYKLERIFNKPKMRYVLGEQISIVDIILDSVKWYHNK